MSADSIWKIADEIDAAVNDNYVASMAQCQDWSQRLRALPSAELERDAVVLPRELFDRVHRVLSCAALVQIRDGERTFNDINARAKGPRR